MANGPPDAGSDGVAAQYAAKPPSYFANARNDIVAMLRTGPDAHSLEIGCGAGGTGRAAIAAGKAGHYTGIELDPAAASIAREGLSEVIEGNVEQLDLSTLAGRYDSLIASEVLEHLIDPWAAVAKLARCLKPGAAVFASSPNVSHWHVIRDLVRGRFNYTESGTMDRTHLHWFTPASYCAMFEAAGIEVLRVEPIRTPGGHARLLNSLTGGRLAHLSMSQIMLSGRKR